MRGSARARRRHLNEKSEVRRIFQPVIPAKAGIHFAFAPHPKPQEPATATAKWIPAFAGMTGLGGIAPSAQSIPASASHSTSTAPQPTYRSRPTGIHPPSE
ncbi:hypothetical protein [Pseudomonas sp. CGJS7]|uniref:hypothetical protein n=1 Tax=Pseudomonas sp. CGJS7 TaxID=3109348 RepID=UPI00300898F0